MAKSLTLTICALCLRSALLLAANLNHLILKTDFARASTADPLFGELGVCLKY